MAHFIGEIRGNRGEASRLGSKTSGLNATLQGWEIGIKVFLTHKDGFDHIAVYRTGGSNNPRSYELIAELKEGE